MRVVKFLVKVRNFLTEIWAHFELLRLILGDILVILGIRVVSLFPRGCYLVGIIILHVHESDMTHQIVHKALRTTQSLVACKRDNYSNNAHQPPSCEYSDVILTTSFRFPHLQ